MTGAQAREAGYTDRTIRWRTGRGAWEAVHPGVYRMAGTPVTWEQRVLAACLATGGVASQCSRSRTSARLHRAAAGGWIVFDVTEEDVHDGCRTLVAQLGRARAA